MDKQRQTLAEFTRAYLRTLEAAAVVEQPIGEGSCKDGFAMNVLLSMRGGKLTAADNASSTPQLTCSVSSQISIIEK